MRSLSTGRNRIRAPAFVAALGCLFASHAQERVGGEFQVNVYTTSLQYRPAVAMDDDRNFVVVWRSYGQDGSSGGIFGRKFTDGGTTPGGEFQVNSYTTSNQRDAGVAMDATGSFVVVWESYGQDQSSFGIFGQRFLPNATPNGFEFQVNFYTTGSQLRPVVAKAPDGSFVVVWHGQSQSDSSGVFAQRYSNDGAAQGDEFRVNIYTTGFQVRPAIAMDAAGNFVVAWASENQDGDLGGIFGQRFGSNGLPVAGEFQVNNDTTGNQYGASVALDADGDFIVTWELIGYGPDLDAFGRRFTSGGAAAGDDFQVNTYTTYAQEKTSVAADADGNFVVVWHSHQDGGGYGIFGQRFTSSGARLGGEFQVNSYTTGHQKYPSVAMDAVGNFVVVWESPGQDGSLNGIFGQRFRFGELDFFIGDEEEPAPSEGAGKQR